MLLIVLMKSNMFTIPVGIAIDQAREQYYQHIRLEFVSAVS